MSVSDALRQRDLEARIVRLEAAGLPASAPSLEARVTMLEEMLPKLTQRVAMLQGQLNALRNKAGIPDAPAYSNAAAR